MLNRLQTHNFQRDLNPHPSILRMEDVIASLYTVWWQGMTWKSENEKN